MAQEIDFFKVKGDAYQIGFQLGEKTRSKTQQYFQTFKPQFTPSQKEMIDSLSKKLLALGEKHLPEQVMEMKGLADGAGIPFKDLFDWNVEKFSGRNIAESCTSVVLKGDNFLIFGHNDDVQPNSNDAFLARIETESGLKILSVCYYGLLPGISASINSEGLIQGLDSLRSSDHGVGLPTFMLFRKTMEAKSLTEAKKFVTTRPISSPDNFLFVKGQDIINIEAASKSHQTIQPGKSFVHTNHFIIPELKHLEAKVHMASSLLRLKKAEEYLEKNEVLQKEEAWKVLKQILTSHDNMPYTICRHGFKKGKEKDTAETIASILIDSSKQEMMVSNGNPCQNKYYRFKL